MKELKAIEDQLKRAYEGEAWHGPSIKEILAGVTAEQASRHRITGSHNIWEIVLHIAAWEGAVRRRLEGDYVSEPAEGDWPTIDDTSEASWRETLAKLESNHMKLRETIAGLDGERLFEPLAEGKPSAYFTLHGIIQHDLYHAGQIALLKKA
ncbi:MAG TPA: DinB family protein [Blastocatellia bacterium]|jgi:uncharacterized damage-inducible protein DinB